MYIHVFTTVKSKDEAVKIANALLEKKLASCVQIIKGVESRFVWQGKKEVVTECLMRIKTKRNLYDKVESAIKTLHTYDIPEITALAVETGYKNYFAWTDSVIDSK